MVREPHHERLVPLTAYPEPVEGFFELRRESSVTVH
jgi:hypothetical protein